MVGIYKITNTINQKMYIGQSKQIEKRWSNHRVAAFNKFDDGYNYPLYAAIRKWCIRYGLPSKRKDIKQISNEDWSNI